MASIFASGSAPVFTEAQKKERITAWKPSPIRASMQLSGDGAVLFRSEKAQAEYDAKAAAKAAAKAEAKAATLAKSAATRAAKKAAAAAPKMKK